jgi:hypothetical protein
MDERGDASTVNLPQKSSTRAEYRRGRDVLMFGAL